MNKYCIIPNIALFEDQILHYLMNKYCIIPNIALFEDQILHYLIVREEQILHYSKYCII